MIALVFFFFAVSVTLIGVALALHVSKRYLWLAALGSWVVSYLGSMSIGLYLLATTFIFVALALGYSMNWLKSGWQEVLAIMAGLALWAIAVAIVDDYWLFLPLSATLDLITR